MSSNENDSHIVTGSATALQQASKPSLDLKMTDGPHGVENKIKTNNIDAARFQQQFFEEFKREIESLKDSKPSWNVWKEKLNRKKVEVKKVSTDRIEKSFLEVIDYVKDLPNEKQELSACSLNTGTDAVARAAEFVCSKMEQLIRAMVDYMMDNWDRVETAYNAVKRCVIKAIEEIPA